jgi:hypothetical protein
MPEPTDDALAPNRELPQKFIVLGLIVAGFLAVTFFSLRWAFGPVEPQKSVAAQWNEAIGRLGIEPVYPPQEDLAVGDIFALVTSDALEDIHQEPLAGRAIKLWHVDLTQDIEDTYKIMYRFPDTKDGAILSPPETAFKIGELRTDLPIAIFPAFTIANIKTAGSSGALSTMFEGLWGGTASSNASAEIKISAAETYGIPALIAETRLYEFCKDYAKAPVCTDQGLRRQLSMVVGSKINEKIKDEKTGKESLRLSVELALISRVYLARTIETVISRQQAIGTQAQLHSAKSAGSEKAGPADSKDASSVSAATGGMPEQASSIETLRREVEAQKAQILALQAKAATGASGLSTLIQSASESAIRLTETTKRPVVIGFRSVRWTPN